MKSQDIVSALNEVMPGTSWKEAGSDTAANTQAGVPLIQRFSFTGNHIRIPGPFLQELFQKGIMFQGMEIKRTGAMAKLTIEVAA